MRARENKVFHVLVRWKSSFLSCGGKLTAKGDPQRGSCKRHRFCRESPANDAPCAMRYFQNRSDCAKSNNCSLRPILSCTHAPPHSRVCFTAVSFYVFSVSFYGSVFLVFSFPSHNARLGERAEKIGLKFQHFHNSASSREWSESIKAIFANFKSHQSGSRTDTVLWMCLRCSFRVEYVL